MPNPSAPSAPRAARPREYRIEPRFLAGPTHTGDPGLQPLLDAGWAATMDELGSVFVNSPDQKIRLGLQPDAEVGELWSISAHSHAFARPEWLVTFDLYTPPEIVGDFTTALAASHAQGHDAFLSGSASAGIDATDPLLQAGWHMDDGPPDLTFHSPDNLITLYRRLGHLRHEAEMSGDAERWLLEVGPPSHRWYATASSHVPDQLLGALTAAAANPAPVNRYWRPADLARLPIQATATPTALSPLEVARMRAATARSTPAPRPSASALAYTTATRPAALPKPALAGRAR